MLGVRVLIAKRNLGINTKIIIMGKKKKSKNRQTWLDVGKKYRLSERQVQMAQQLGLNPKKVGGYANHRQEPWKRPLGEFIEELYQKRFGGKMDM